MDVKSSTERKLRAAMERLFEGAATHTDGSLTIANLAVEAGVSRATLYRAHTIVVEFQNRAIDVAQKEQAVEAPERVLSLSEQVRACKRQLAETVARKNAIIDDLRVTIDLLARKVQALKLDNERLRRESSHASGNITDLRLR